jgi:hypothetical protein
LDINREWVSIQQGVTMGLVERDDVLEFRWTLKEATKMFQCYVVIEKRKVCMAVDSKMHP